VRSAWVLVLLVLAAPAVTAEEWRWDLGGLFADADAWERERAALVADLPKLASLRGAASQPGGLRRVLDAMSDSRARASRLAVYGMLAEEADMASPVTQRQYDVGTGLETTVEAAIEPLEQEVHALGAAGLQEALRADPGLEQRHGRRLRRMLREKPYVLGAEAQAVLEAAGRWTRLPTDVWYELQEADLGWPEARAADGTPVKLDRTGFLRLRRSPLAADRAAAEGHLRKLEALQEPFGLLYTRRIEADLVLAQQRGFASGIDALWFLRDGLPGEAVGVLRDVAREGRPVLHRYLRARARLSGSGKASYPDLYAPPPGLPSGPPIDAAVEAAVTALAPLGDDFVAAARRHTTSRTLDLLPRPGKRATFGVFPPVGGAPPYTIFSYDGTYAGARTLAGALVIGTAFAGVPKDRGPDTRDDPPSWGNGIIYVGELLHDDQRARRERDPKVRAAILMSQLDRIRAQFFDWALWVEMDAEVERRIRDGRTPTGADLSALYLQLLRETYGQGTVAHVPEAWRTAWITAPVPFLSYEHHFWPTAMAGACAVLDRLAAGDTAARRAVTAALGRGEMDLSGALFATGGVDLASPAPYRAVLRRMERLLDELEPLLPPS
jgi:oligoendopeptidase F